MNIPFNYVAQGNLVELRTFLSTNDITIKDERQNSLLHLAIKYNQSEIFQFLIDNYININMQNDDLETPLMLCVYYNRLGFIKTLIKLKANYLLKNKLGETPFYKACLLGRNMVVSLLIENNMATMDCKNNNDEDIYFAIVKSQNMSLIEHFAKENPDFYKTSNYFNENLLHIATKLNSFDMVNFLLKNNVYVNAKNKAKETPLFYACKNASFEIASLLIDNGAILDLKNLYDESIIDLCDYASFKDYISDKANDVKYLNYLRDYKLHIAIIKEDLFEVERIITPYNVNMVDSFGKTPLDIAYHLLNKEIIKFLEKYKYELKK